MTKSTYSFLDDYSEGCHPAILQAMAKTNMATQVAYGDDEYTERASHLICEQLGQKGTPVYFVASGTLANIIIISSALKPHEAVISAATGHAVVRETGAIEATGHKMITVPSDNGKLTPQGVETALSENAHFPHMAKPRMVYISNATEAGTIYSKKELVALSTLCDKKDLLLMLDGARLGAALTADRSDMTLADVAELTDIFWIGGTKTGALIGEAIVIPNAELARDFPFHIKQRGALLAKGRLLGLQFSELFSNNLYFELSAHANQMAKKLSEAIAAAGYGFAAETESNQLFPILPDALIDRLQKQFDFYVWGKAGDKKSVVRLVTSWATETGQVDAFIESMNSQQ